MASDRARIALLALAAWAFVLAAIVATGALVAADLPSSDRAELTGLLLRRVATVVVAALLILAPIALVVRALFRRHVKAAERLAEDARIMLSANPAHRAAAQDAPALA